MHHLVMQIDRIKCCNRDAEEQEDKNSIWLKEADLSTLSVDKEVIKQELDSYSEKKEKMVKCFILLSRH